MIMNIEKYLLNTVKAIEALEKLKISDFKQYESKRATISKDIFKSIVNESEPSTREAIGIAETYLKRFRYPFFKSISSYEKLDLALALNHHYLNDLGIPAFELNKIDATQKQLNTIAKALFNDFDHTAIPADEESKKVGRIGEFKRYLANPKKHQVNPTFYSAIEGKRSAQYAALGLPSYWDSVRYAVIQSECEKLSMERSKADLQQEVSQPAPVTETRSEAVEMADIDDLEFVEVDVPDDIYDDDYTDYNDSTDPTEKPSETDDDDWTRI